MIYGANEKISFEVAKFFLATKHSVAFPSFQMIEIIVSPAPATEQPQHTDSLNKHDNTKSNRTAETESRNSVGYLDPSTAENLHPNISIKRNDRAKDSKSPLRPKKNLYGSNPAAIPVAGGKRVGEDAAQRRRSGSLSDSEDSAIYLPRSSAPIRPSEHRKSRDRHEKKKPGNVDTAHSNDHHVAETSSAMLHPQNCKNDNKEGPRKRKLSERSRDAMHILEGRISLLSTKSASVISRRLRAT